MSKLTGGALLARSLQSAGADTLFFLAGGPMAEVIGEAVKLGIRLIDVRHEQAAAMMAHAYSRVSGRVGVCMTASGAATANAVTGIAVANDDCAPVVHIGGSATLISRGMGSFEEMDQVALMRPITKRAWQIPAADRIPDFVDAAFRQATGNRPGPVYLDLPGDVLYASLEDDQVKLPAPPKPSRPAGDETQIDEAVKLLQAAERPIIIAGSGAVWSDAGAELQQLVELTNIPFFTTPLARGLVPEDHRLCFPGARSYAWQSADVVMVIGTRANFIVQYLRPPRFSHNLKLIMANIDAEELGRNRAVDIGIVGDARAVLAQFIERARETPVRLSEAERQWVAQLQKVDAQRWAKVQPLLNSDEKPVHPLRLCKELSALLPRDAILAVDGQEILNFARQSIPSYLPRHRLNPGSSGCMGVGVPFGIGARVAAPEGCVVVLSGDGSFGMNGVEMDTAVRHGLKVVVVISNNGGWAGRPSGWAAGRELGYSRYDRLVEALGGAGYFVEEPAQIRPALEKAFAGDRPALVNVLTSPVKAATQPFSSVAMSEM